MPHGSDGAHARSVARRELTLQLVRQGLGVQEALADPRIGVSYSAYRQWRERYRNWAAEIDNARAVMYDPKVKHELNELTSAQFAMRYFGRKRTTFQQRWIDEVQSLPKGDILLTLWPPEYGKTTTFEDFATEQVCRDAQWRNTTVSENDQISKRIVGRVRKRLEASGPFPQLIKDWGPFRPMQADRGEGAQPWNNAFFSVKDKKMGDERDYNMLAIGWTSSSVSIRTDHLHCDDLQSLKTLSRTAKLLDIFRQDLLSRPGESGITSVSGTRVDDGDVYEALLEDDELGDILHVLRFPAIIFDENGNPSPLWPDKHSLHQLDRIRRKIKDPAFDRNYMMAPGQSRTKFTFGDEGWGRAKMDQYSLNQAGLWLPGKPKTTAVMSLDPGLEPGVTCLGGWEMTEEYMRLAYFHETDTNVRNEEIISDVQAAARFLTQDYRLQHLAVESKNFQRGLARDERLELVAKHFGFTIAEHDTGMNKYDESIGLASMAADWTAGKILLPYAPGGDTRTEIDEFRRQFRKWKPDPKTGLVAKGNKVRYDRLMMTWFAWIWWVNNRHRLTGPVTTIKRGGMPYSPSGMKPIIPIGARLG